MNHDPDLPPPSSSSSSIRCLWKPSTFHNNNNISSQQQQQQQQSYEDIYNQYCSFVVVPSSSSSSSSSHRKDTQNRTTSSSLLKPHQQQRLRIRRMSRLRYISNALVVVQEFIFTYYYFIWYKIIIITSTSPKIGQQPQPQPQLYINLSMIFMYSALLLAVIINARCGTTTSGKIVVKESNYYYYYYYYKVIYRICDAIILGVLLRYIAVLLRNCTASFSTDTVEYLSIITLILHVLFCDYTYANGITSRKDDNSNSNSSMNPILLYTTKITTTFQGGTVSLNAIFFATIVLVSRFQENSNANTNTTTTTTFLYISLAVILFAFYPITRHTISTIYPSHKSVFHWCITASVLLSTQCLLLILDTAPIDDDVPVLPVPFLYTILFWMIILLLGIVIPLWKHYLAQYKVQLRGPWDIPTKDDMHLDYIYDNRKI